MIISPNGEDSFIKLWTSDYLEYNDEKEEYYLLEGAPLELHDILKEYKEIEAEEKRTGKHIF